MFFIFFILFALNRVINSILISKANLCFCTKTEISVCQSFSEFKVHDSTSIEAHCYDAVKIHLIHPNGTERMYAWLHETGIISGKDIDVNKLDCRRTKIYRINQTQVLLRFGEVSKVVNIADIENTISILLWKHEKITYGLNSIGVYLEKTGCYDVLQSIQVYFYLLNLFISLCINAFQIIY